MQEKYLIKHHRAKKIRRVLIPALSFVAILCAIGVGTFIYQNMQNIAQKEENQTFVEENAHSYTLGETVVLDTDEDEKGSQYGDYVAGFMWKGSLEYSIKEAKVYTSYQESGLSAEKQLKTLEGDDRLVVLTVELYNKDAVSFDPDNPNLYLISLFSNLITTDSSFASFGQIAYFDGTPSDLDSKKKAHYFRLSQGERKTYTVALKAPSFAVNEKTLIGIGVSNLGKYTVNLGLPKENA